MQALTHCETIAGLCAEGAPAVVRHPEWQSLLSKDNIDAKHFGIPTIKKFGKMSTGKFVKFVDIDDIDIGDMFSTTSMTSRNLLT